MWRKRPRPTPEELAPRDDLDQARQELAKVRSGIIDLRAQEGFVERISNIMIDRQGNNHYMELLYTHVPGSAR